MSRRDETPRDLLFGLLALQIGLIDQDQLLAAFGAWSRAKNKALAEILLERGSIDEEERSLLAGMAEKQLRKHGGDTERSLSAVRTGQSTCDTLEALGDPELTETLHFVGRTNPSDDPTATRSVGTSTGDGQRFRVIRPHAQGGLGAVFVALDGELNREVALKQILDQHADDPVSRTRFLLEAEITGGLEHPGIVPVYGLGHYHDGRPYYAMRFIRGDSLKEAIAAFHEDDSLKTDPGKRSLALRKLMRRFVDVCNAIDYAHGRGVLHRDLKPGNVIVGKHGETLVVDWGLAKPLGHSEVDSRSDERTLIPTSSTGSAETLPGSALGTPAYMSPEQASGDLEKLGPRSDVYSLGATLYCLLTGRPPFSGPLVGAILRNVQQGDFPTPRQVDPSIDQALESVCLKAMSVDPDDRHASARALADDVERWAADEPVSAWREPNSVRARRWMRRNRTAVTAASASLLMAVVGLAGVLVVQSKANATLKAKNIDLDLANVRESAANRGLRRANDLVSKANSRLEAQNADLDRANRLKDEANAGLLEANAKVQARFDLAREAIRSFQAGVSDDDVLKGEELKPLRNKLLKSAAGFYEKLEKLLQGQADRNSRAILAQSYFELGELTDQIGVRREALAVHRKALAIRRALADGPLADLGAKLDLARSLLAEGTLAEATSAHGLALASFHEARDLARPIATDKAREIQGQSLHRLGLVLAVTGKPDEAFASYREALAIQQALADDHPTSADFQAHLARTHNSLGSLQNQTGRPAEALASYLKGLAIRRKLADDHPEATPLRRELAVSHHNVALLQVQSDHPAEGLASYLEAMEIQRKLAQENPAVTLFRRDLASTHNNVGNLHLMKGRHAEALASFREALAIGRKLVDDNPAITEFRRDLANSHNNIGGLHAAAGRTDEAFPSYLEALAIRGKLAEDHPAVTLFRSNLAASQYNIGILYVQASRPDEALALYREALATFKKLADDNPTTASYRTNLSMCHNNIGILHLQARRRDVALVSFREALAIQRKLAPDATSNHAARSNLADTLNNMGTLLTDDGRPDEALTVLLEALAIRRKLVFDQPTIESYRASLAECLTNIGRLHSSSGRSSEALASFREALEIRERLADDQLTVPRYQRDLASGLGQVGAVLARNGDLAGAIAHFRSAIQKMECLPMTAEWLFELACYQSTLARLLDRSDSEMADNQAETFARAAVSTLKRAIEAGYRDFAGLRIEPDLARLRLRPDFQALTMDLGFPSDPFAR